MPHSHKRPLIISANKATLQRIALASQAFTVQASAEDVLKDEYKYHADELKVHRAKLLHAVATGNKASEKHNAMKVNKHRAHMARIANELEEMGAPIKTTSVVLRRISIALALRVNKHEARNAVEREALKERMERLRERMRQHKEAVGNILAPRHSGHWQHLVAPQLPKGYHEKYKALPHNDRVKIDHHRNAYHEALKKSHALHKGTHTAAAAKKTGTIKPEHLKVFRDKLKGHNFHLKLMHAHHSSAAKILGVDGYLLTSPAQLSRIKIGAHIGSLVPSQKKQFDHHMEMAEKHRVAANKHAEEYAKAWHAKNPGYHSLALFEAPVPSMITADDAEHYKAKVAHHTKHLKRLMHEIPGDPRGDHRHMNEETEHEIDHHSERLNHYRGKLKKLEHKANIEMSAARSGSSKFHLEHRNAHAHKMAHILGYNGHVNQIVHEYRKHSPESFKAHLDEHGISGMKSASAMHHHSEMTKHAHLYDAAVRKKMGLANVETATPKKTDHAKKSDFHLRKAAKIIGLHPDEMRTTKVAHLRKIKTKEGLLSPDKKRDYKAHMIRHQYHEIYRAYPTKSAQPKSKKAA